MGAYNPLKNKRIHISCSIARKTTIKGKYKAKVRMTSRPWRSCWVPKRMCRTKCPHGCLQRITLQTSKYPSNGRIRCQLDGWMNVSVNCLIWQAGERSFSNTHPFHPRDGWTCSVKRSYSCTLPILLQKFSIYLLY